MNKFKADREDLDVRIKALELAIELCKHNSTLYKTSEVINNAYNFYDFLSSDAEVSIKPHHLITDEPI